MGDKAPLYRLERTPRKTSRYVDSDIRSGAVMRVDTERRFGEREPAMDRRIDREGPLSSLTSAEQRVS